MDTARIASLSGFVTVPTGVLLFLLGILPSVLLGGDSIVDAVLDPQWTILSIFAFVLMVLTTFSVLGLYLRQTEETGILGLVGFILTLVGLLLTASIQFDLAFIWPILAVEAPEMLPPGGPMYSDTTFMIAHTLFNSFFLLGFLIFGIATIRGRVFNRWAAVLFTVGMPLTAGILFPPLIIRAIGAIIGSAGLVWMGYFLCTENVE